METRGAFDYAERAATREILAAKTALQDLPDGEPVAMLDAIADYVLTRQS